MSGACPDPVGLPGTGQVAPGQYPPAPGHPFGGWQQVLEVGRAGDHPGDRALAAAQGPLAGGGGLPEEAVLSLTDSAERRCPPTWSDCFLRVPCWGRCHRGGRFRRHRPGGGRRCVLSGVELLVQKLMKRRRPLLKLDLLATWSDPSVAGPQRAGGKPSEPLVPPPTTAVGVMLTPL